MKIIRVVFYFLLAIQTLIFAQHTRPDKMPKIGVIYGTVVDSLTREPIQYASISVINSRTNEVITGGITNEKGGFRIQEIPLGRTNVMVEFIGFEKKMIGPVALSPRGDGIEQDLG